MRQSSPGFEKALALQEERGTLLPYLSKSRLMQYIKNPYHFYLVYIRGLREPENAAMRRGSSVHMAYELYYENVKRVYEETGGVYEDLTKYLPPVDEWSEWTEPYMMNFLRWEYRRLAASSCVSDFVPVAIEAEAWDFEPPVGTVPWMGYADVILNARSVPEIEIDEGVVIIDFKTGNGEKAVKYQDKQGSVLDELEYYAMLFEDEYEIAALGGYYPMHDILISAESSEERRRFLLDTIAELSEKGDDGDEYEVVESPLCKWGPTDEQQSAFYHICPCSWGTKSGAGPTYCDDEKRPLS